MLEPELESKTPIRRIVDAREGVVAATVPAGAEFLAERIAAGHHQVEEFVGRPKYAHFDAALFVEQAVVDFLQLVESKGQLARLQPAENGDVRRKLIRRPRIEAAEHRVGD